jgi:hypothetical protein
MSSALLLSLLLITQNPVQIQLSSMSAADVQVARDGYLLVLGSAERGQPIVVYPSRPTRDGHVTAGATVKVRSWRAFTWVAVWSDQPFDASRFTANTYWSTDSLRRAGDGASVDALVGVARRMARGSGQVIEYALASPPPFALVYGQPHQYSRRITIAPGAYYRYLSPQNWWQRQAKFAGGPPDVCNAQGTVCALSVWRQLGNMQFTNAP